ncbi:hypothetical protein FRB96_009298 [Tulasnella sp. 330]|nr:hypothetical protein FRB96_009298 [Tulasnella sp. 330]
MLSTTSPSLRTLSIQSSSIPSAVLAGSETPNIRSLQASWLDDDDDEIRTGLIKGSRNIEELIIKPHAFTLTDQMELHTETFVTDPTICLLA